MTSVQRMDDLIKIQDRDLIIDQFSNWENNDCFWGFFSMKCLCVSACLCTIGISPRHKFQLGGRYLHSTECQELAASCVYRFCVIVLGCTWQTSQPYRHIFAFPVHIWNHFLRLHFNRYYCLLLHLPSQRLNKNHPSVPL